MNQDRSGIIQDDTGSFIVEFEADNEGTVRARRYSVIAWQSDPQAVPIIAIPLKNISKPWCIEQAGQYHFPEYAFEDDNGPDEHLSCDTLDQAKQVWKSAHADLFEGLGLSESA